MKRLPLKQPLVLIMMGYPGAGKSFFARQFATEFGLANVSSDRVRYELFDEPTYKPQGSDIVRGVLGYMTEELLRCGNSIILDSNHNKRRRRRDIRELAKQHGATTLTVWVQTDLDTAYSRAHRRDRRNSDNKYAVPVSADVFDNLRRNLQQPDNEPYVVISGKHTFEGQLKTVLRKLDQLELLNMPASLPSQAAPRAMLGGRNDISRRPYTFR